MKLANKLLFVSLLLATLTSCQKNFLDLNPQDSYTDAVYFKSASDYKTYASGFYPELMGWASPYASDKVNSSATTYNVYNFMDISSDLSSSTLFSSDLGRGTISAITSDSRWDNSYYYIRSNNILLTKAQSYTGTTDITPYVGEAYFFRAYNYFQLLKFYGGVPIVKTVLDVNSTELKSPRNSRYEVVNFILSDLDSAIKRLPTEQEIAESDKGRISKWAAESLKATIELYEATWRKYNGTTTDFSGSTGPSSDQTKSFFTDAVSLCRDVMNNGGYALWNYNSTASMYDLSYVYLFNLEDAGSNPAGLTKTSNKEFILYGLYDYTYRKGGVNLSHTMELLSPTRSFMDMCLCTDGLPAAKSSLFQGYHHTGDEFKNRDLRLLCYLNASTTVPSAGSVNLNLGLSGYNNRKFVAYKYGTYRTDNNESQNFPIIRLAEIYLTYAEALYELNGSITDAQLDSSINLIRDRAGVAHLSNELVSSNGLTMLDEIRRERAVELYEEGKRFDDLKRWGLLAADLNPSRCGMVVGNGSYTTDFRDASDNATSLYTPSTYSWGEEAVSTAVGTLSAVVLDSYKNHTVTKTHYLWPLPIDQLELNPNLVQNPGY